MLGRALKERDSTNNSSPSIPLLRLNSSYPNKTNEQDYIVHFVRDDSSKFNIALFFPILISAICAVAVTILCLCLLKACTLINKFIAWYDKKYPPKRPKDDDDSLVREEFRKKGLLLEPREPQVQINNFVGNNTQNA